jgi:predicted nucleic acid-binding protein
LILADTSAWVEYLRGTGSPVSLRLRSLLVTGSLATTDVVVMEVLAGARDDLHRQRLRTLLGQCEYVRTSPPDDFERAAALSVKCRRSGFTIRALTDCLLAAVALREGAAILHVDRDFDAIARCAPLVLDPA